MQRIAFMLKGLPFNPDGDGSRLVVLEISRKYNKV